MNMYNKPIKLSDEAEKKLRESFDMPIEQAYDAIKEECVDENARLRNESRLKSLRDHYARMSDNWRQGYLEGFQQGLDEVAAIFKQHRQGIPPEQIAADLSIPIDKVYRIIKKTEGE